LPLVCFKKLLARDNELLLGTRLHIDLPLSRTIS